MWTVTGAKVILQKWTHREDWEKRINKIEQTGKIGRQGTGPESGQSVAWVCWWLPARSVRARWNQLETWRSLWSWQSRLHDAKNTWSCTENLMYSLCSAPHRRPGTWSPCTTSRFHTSRTVLTYTHAEVFTSDVIFLRIDRTVSWLDVIRCRMRWDLLEVRTLLRFVLFNRTC